MQIEVRVIPKAKQNKIIELEKNSFKVWLTIAPVDGKANQALIKELAKFLKIKKSQLEIIRGFKGRDKVLEINF